MLIILAVDRFARDPTDFLVLARHIQRAGAGLRSLAEAGRRHHIRICRDHPCGAWGGGEVAPQVDRHKTDISHGRADDTD